ncbi:MAG: hypothetical protein ACKVOK_00810 [Flavobacteriales bacterium]
MNYCFGIISEGPSDQWVIKSILSGFFKTSNPSITSLQPNVDATTGKFDDGNWDKVIKFIQTENFREAFDNVNYVILQIDTDWVDGKEHSYDISFELSESTEDRVAKMKNFLVHQMSAEIRASFLDRVIWAISDRQIECWLLPLFVTNKKSDLVKTINCLETLNPYLQSQLGFRIDRKEKGYYEKASKGFRDSKLYVSREKLQFSTRVFLDCLDFIFPDRVQCPEL